MKMVRIDERGRDDDKDPPPGPTPILRESTLY